MGDETAIPAIARRLEELPASCKAIVIIKIASEDSKIELQDQCDFEVRWVLQDRDASPEDEVEALAASLGELVLPAKAMCGRQGSTAISRPCVNALLINSRLIKSVFGPAVTGVNR